MAEPWVRVGGKRKGVDRWSVCYSQFIDCDLAYPRNPRLCRRRHGRHALVTIPRWWEGFDSTGPPNDEITLGWKSTGRESRRQQIPDTGDAVSSIWRTRLPSAKPVASGVVREGFCHLGHGCQRSHEGCGDTIQLSNRTLFQNQGNFESISKNVVCISRKTSRDNR